MKITCLTFRVGEWVGRSGHDTIDDSGCFLNTLGIRSPPVPMQRGVYMIISFCQSDVEV